MTEPMTGSRFPVVFAIYENPTDYPNKFVVREWRGLVANLEPHMVTSSLREARESVPEGLINIGRREGDDTKIVEVWI